MNLLLLVPHHGWLSPTHLFVLQLIKEVSSEANAVLNDFQSSLTSQEQTIASLLEQQYEVCDWSSISFTNFETYSYFLKPGALLDTLVTSRILLLSSQRHAKTYQTTQTVSRTTLNFCKMLSAYISKLTLIVEEEQKIDDQKLCALKKNYEVRVQ